MFCWRKQRSSILTRPSTRQKFGAVCGTNRFPFEEPRNIFTRLPKGLIVKLLNGIAARPFNPGRWLHASLFRPGCRSG